MKFKLNINGETRAVDAEPKASLLWILRDELKLVGTKYGCGIAACGACMVHVNGKSTYSCQLKLADIKDKKITTIEGLSKDNSHPIQQAWIEEQVPQCGYCQSGQIMRASELLASNARPSREDIVNHMSTNLCRCGTYPRIIAAIEKAADKISKKNV